MPDIGSISLTSPARVPRADDRAGAPRLMAAGRRLLSAVALGLIAVGLPASAAGHDGITGVFVEPDRVNPGGVIVVRGDNVSTDDPVRIELIAGVTRIELGTAVTDGEGHFTIGATIPPETPVGPYAIEVSGQSGVRMSVDLLVEGSPFYDGQNGAPPGRDEGLPAMPSLDARIPDQRAGQPLAAVDSDLDLVPLVALGLAVGGFVLFTRWSRRPARPTIGSTDLP